MTAHELGKLLLEGPDLPATVYVYECATWTLVDVTGTSAGPSRVLIELDD